MKVPRRFSGYCLALLSFAATHAAWAQESDVASQVRARKAELAPLCPGLLALKVPLTPQQTSQKALCQLYGLNTPEPTPEPTKAPNAPVPVNNADPFSDPLSNSDSLPPGYHCHFYGLGKKVCHGMGFD